MSGTKSWWRLLAWTGKRGHEQAITLENVGALDEVTVGGWLHVERMGENSWSVIVGDHILGVRVRRDGTPEVTVVDAPRAPPPPPPPPAPAPPAPPRSR